MTLTLTTSRRLRSTDSRRRPIPYTGRCRSSAISLARHIHLAGDLAFLVVVTNRNNVPGLSYELAAGKAGLSSEFIPHSLWHCYASTALAHGTVIIEVSTSCPPPGIAFARSLTTPAAPDGTHPRLIRRP